MRYIALVTAIGEIDTSIAVEANSLAEARRKVLEKATGSGTGVTWEFAGVVDGDRRKDVNQNSVKIKNIYDSKKGK